MCLRCFRLRSLPPGRLRDRQGSDVIIDMSDISTGGQTQITLPVPTY